MPPGLGGHGFGVLAREANNIVWVARDPDPGERLRGVYDVQGDGSAGHVGLVGRRSGGGVGFAFLSGTGLRIEGLRMHHVRGGVGTLIHEGFGTRGGPGVGIRLEDAGDVRVEGSEMTAVVGGRGAGHSPPGPRYGVELLGDLQDVFIGPSNTVDTMPVFAAFSPLGTPVVAEGLRMVGDVVTTSLGRVVVVDVPDARIANNTIAGLSGGPGLSGWVSAPVPERRGDDAHGIYARNAAALVVEGNTIQRIAAGDGGSIGNSNNLPGGTGGDAYGIRLEQCSDARLVANTVTDVSGGTNGASGALGSAFGVTIDGGDLRARNTLVHDIDGRLAVGIRVGDVGDVHIRGATLRDVGRGDGSAGIGVSTVQDMRVSEVVFEDLPTDVDDTGESEGRVHVEYVARFRVDVSEFAADGERYIELDASCLGDDLTILAGSACVDAGREGDCGDEPGGAACRLDLGHESGTAEALTNPP